jgi:hypothetical protein
LVGARGGARPVAQARGSLRAGTRQGVRRGSSPKWRADGEGVPGGDPEEVLRLRGGMRSLGPSQFGREGTNVELTEEGNDGGASAQIR